MDDFAQSSAGVEQGGQAGYDAGQVSNDTTAVDNTQYQSDQPQQVTLSAEEAIAQLEAANAARELYQQQNQFYQEMLFQKNAQGQQSQVYGQRNKAYQEALNQLQDGDYVSRDVYQKSLDAMYDGLRSEMQEQIVAVTEYAARQAHPDFDEVVTRFTADIVRKNPDMYNFIMMSRNPSETAYQMGLTHEGYIAEKTKASTANVVNKINQNIKARPTLATQIGASTANTGITADSVKNMSSEDFAKLVEQSKKSGLPF